MSFSSVLIANRGEIALRIMRTLRQMGLGAVAVYTTEDETAPHVQAADRAVQVPSYLDSAAIVEAARAVGAVHPGYGFLSENAEFAQACAQAGVVFIGPGADAVALMGDKARAKHAAQQAGVPVLPGYDGADQDALAQEAARIGVPLMVKAAMGGGGKGMRLVTDLAALPEALERAASEARRSFGDGRLILERAVLEPRHVEVQVFGDIHGNLVHLFERDCSVQRRHQKVIEEAPSPAVDDALRKRMGEAAISLARACGYVGAGTVEFLLDGDEFWFLEMNTRLQVEHPVTERVTGVDLVEWQIRVARGEPLPLAQESITMTGHAIEARLYAEDPQDGFLPQTGRVLAWQVDDDLRCDHAIEVGTLIGAGFDPMLGKLIAWGPDRATACARLAQGLRGAVLQGVRSNLRFAAAVVSHPDFVAGKATTGFLDGPFAGDPCLTAGPVDDSLLALAVLLNAGAPHVPLGLFTGPAPVLRRRFDTGHRQQDVTMTLDRGGVAHLTDGTAVRVLMAENGWVTAQIGGDAQRFAVARAGNTLWLGDVPLRDATLDPSERRAGPADGRVVAPMAGTVTDVFARVGDRVEQGEVLMVLEAMKMEHPVKAPCAGTITHAGAGPGTQVKARAELFTIEPIQETP